MRGRSQVDIPPDTKLTHRMNHYQRQDLILTQDHLEFIQILQRHGYDVEMYEPIVPYPSPLVNMSVTKAIIAFASKVEHKVERLNEFRGFSGAKIIMSLSDTGDLRFDKKVIKIWEYFGNMHNMIHIIDSFKYIYGSDIDLIEREYKKHGYCKTGAEFVFIAESHPCSLAFNGEMYLTPRTLPLGLPKKEGCLDEFITDINTRTRMSDSCEMFVKTLPLSGRVTWKDETFIRAIIIEILIIQKRQDLIRCIGDQHLGRYMKKQFRDVIAQHLTYNHIFPEYPLEHLDGSTMILPGFGLYLDDYDHPDTIAIEKYRKKKGKIEMQFPRWKLYWSKPVRSSPYYYVYIYTKICSTKINTDPFFFDVDLLPSKQSKEYMKSVCGPFTNYNSSEIDQMERERREYLSNLKTELEEACPDGVPYIVWGNPNSSWVQSFMSHYTKERLRK